MRFFKWEKDGGPESRVHGLFLIEDKKRFSIVLLRFSDGTRDAYHGHAFNSVSWLLKGQLEEMLVFFGPLTYRPSWHPIRTWRETTHKVRSIGTSWVLSFRGPWSDTWKEYTNQHGWRTLTHGRVEVA